MQSIIDAINAKITVETSLNMTTEQEYYIAGLSDALEIVKEHMEQDYAIGKTYYVIMPDDFNDVKIEQMRLYRINKKKKLAYCFTRYLTGNVSAPDLVLYSKGSLKLRVHETKEEAEKYKSMALYHFNKN